MKSPFTVIYDACVLYPAPLRDLLMRLALTDMFRAKWTEQIHEEWIRNLLDNRPDLSIEDLKRTCKLMNANVRDCLVYQYEELIPSINIPDENDRHVVAAAIKSNAELIITFNLKDFPSEAIKKYDLSAIHPDEFIMDLIDLDEIKVCEAVKKQRMALTRPSITVDDLLNVLLKQGLTETVNFLQDWKFLL